MSEVTLVLNGTQYTVDSQLLIKHSQFLKDLIDTYPNKKEFNLTFPIKSLNKFLDYMNGKTTTSLDYDEFIVHQYLDTKSYFYHLIYLMVEEGIDHEKIRSLNDDISWEIYDHLPLNMVPQEMLTDAFIERYKTKMLPEYPKNLILIRNEGEVRTEVLIFGKYYTDGLYQSWYPNGEKEEVSNWLEGVRHGLYQSWYPNGQMKEESNWLEGERHGSYETWYENGEREEESNWLQSKNHGLYRIWQENGQISVESNWSEGVRDGLSQLWYENGEREEVSNWSKGIRDGLFQSWYGNGRKKEESNWSKGIKDGLFQHWSVTGKIREESNWLQGDRHTHTVYRNIGM